MKMRKICIGITILTCFLLMGTGCNATKTVKTGETESTEMPTSTVSETDIATEATTDGADSEFIVYENSKYGFKFKLPTSWEGYSIVDESWTGTSADLKKSGPEILIRHPNWTEAKPMQDIPILIFTPEEWQDISAEKYNVSAAPIPPTLIGKNNHYVFALPPRYNFAYLEGYEEVEAILSDNPLEVFEIK